MKIRAILLRTVIVLLLMAAAGFVAVKSRGPRETGRDSAGKPAENAVPATASTPHGLAFASTVVEARVAPDATHAQLDFLFENRTDRTLTISRVEKNCACMEMLVSGGKLVYAPGEKGVIRARYELGNMIGTVDKDFMLWLEGDPEEKPSHVLVSRLIIPELVVLSEKNLKWQIGKPADPKKIDITIHGDQPIRITGSSSTSNDIRIELKTLGEGRRYELWVTPASTSEPGLSAIRLDTDSTIPRWKAVQVFATVQDKPIRQP
ncbi:MAG: DUF1573 domain-containing protein [Verrucomicrobia bacterium]|nr:DUF1573 domain-containing protein [Verrucomicrobiota bacterium]